MAEQRAQAKRPFGKPTPEAMEERAMSDITQHNAKIVDQHTQQAEVYAKLIESSANSDRRAALRAMINLCPEDNLLDVACGPGSVALNLAPYIHRAVGLDITPAMLDQARKAQINSGISNVEWIEGDALALPFPDGSFSAVTSSSAFHHLEDPAGVLAEMERVCRHGGRIVVMDVTPQADKAIAYDRLERMRDPSHGHAHSVEELAVMGAKLGLGLPEVQTSMAGPMPFESVLAASHPEEYSREELLDLMRNDALSGEDQFGFRAEVCDGRVYVTYRTSIICWTKQR